MLKSLEISGFKSFAKKSLLEFRTPISAIVGPNGSGKSNIAEGFRFVLGEQSIKSLRGKKGEDLIFNGSPTSARSNRASVKVCFDNTKRNLNIDFDEVCIERIVHRDGINQYLINGSEVRLKDIIELLSRAHIGSSGHHIISQGEADRILNISPKERKGMIEDALGLKIYQYKKEESLRKLAKTRENIKSVESLRREIAPHLRFLKKQMERIEKVLEMKDELKMLALEYFKRESIYLRINKSQVLGEKKEPEKNLKRLEEELQRVRSIIEKSDRNDDSLEESIKLQKLLEENRAEISALERDLGRIEGEINSAERNIKRQREMGASEQSISVSYDKLQTLRKEIDFFIDESELESDSSKLKQIIARIKKTIIDFFETNRDKQSEIDRYIQKDVEEIENLKDKKIQIERNIKSKYDSGVKINSEHSAIKEKIEKEKDSFKDAEKEIYRIMAIQNDVKSVLNSLCAREDKILLEEDEYKREMAEVAMLVGREVLAYENLSLSESEQEIAREDRKIQEDRKKAVEKLKIRLEDQGVSGSDDVMKEYKETSERDTFLEKELNDLVLSAGSLEELIKNLEEKLSIEFKEGIQKINEEFNKFFNLMFGGGEAWLVVSLQKKKKRRDTDIVLGDEIPEDRETNAEGQDTEEEAEEGIELNVSLPHKKIKGLMMLSGGERALTSIALLFAISQVNPPPFIILDETDAALDEANSKRYSDMVKALSAHSQLILITHNRETMNVAGVLYGITMGSDGVSKLLSVNFEEATSYAK